ncbi:MAG: hypothetical protein QF752_00015 [Planctomycetota bacterium]|nr:hypothetical protein [Planctomycetota bacterium]
MIAVALATSLSGQIRFDDSFPEAARRDLTTVAHEVLAVVRERMPTDPPAGVRPLVCFLRPEGPIADSTSDPSVYRIGLTVTGRQFAQLAYQLGHELGHVWLDPRRTNGLLETLAVALSHQVLVDLAQRWKTRAPYPNWTSYAPQFLSYLEETVSKQLETFPESVRAMVKEKRWEELGLYLRYRRPDQDREATDRSLNTLGAVALRSEPVDWKEWVGVGSRTDPPPSRDGRFRADLQLTGSGLPSCLRRIGRRRPTDFVAARFRTRPPENGGLVIADGTTWLWLREFPKKKGLRPYHQIRRRRPIDSRYEAGQGEVRGPKGS